ncbi:MAG: hypothetical protein U5K54_24270 [Cytophagales bacterium]|nr:hypothetical protein [Cytophagales bacterium]
MAGFLLGLDIGSSSVKASLVAVDSGQTVVSTQSPVEEMEMIAVHYLVGQSKILKCGGRMFAKCIQQCSK